jgi:hypothetical protein
VAGATLAFSPKMGSLALFLSEAGDLDDFSATYKLLKFIGKKLRTTLRVEYSNGGACGTLDTKSPGEPQCGKMTLVLNAAKIPQSLSFTADLQPCEAGVSRA